MMHRAWSSIVEVPYCFFKVIRQISRSHGSKNRRIWPKLGVSGQQLQFEFTDGYEMLHKAWNSKGEVPYCFPRSSIKFQSHTGQNITDFDPNWAFPDYRPVAAFKSLRFALLIHDVLNASCYKWQITDIQALHSKFLLSQDQIFINKSMYQGQIWYIPHSPRIFGLLSCTSIPQVSVVKCNLFSTFDHCSETWFP